MLRLGSMVIAVTLLAPSLAVAAADPTPAEIWRHRALALPEPVAEIQVVPTDWIRLESRDGGRRPVIRDDGLGMVRINVALGLLAHAGKDAPQPVPRAKGRKKREPPGGELNHPRLQLAFEGLATPAVAARLSDPDAHLAAALAVERLGDRRPLYRAAPPATGARELRDLAVELLEALAGRSFGRSAGDGAAVAAHWRSWWNEAAGQSRQDWLQQGLAWVRTELRQPRTATIGDLAELLRRQRLDPSAEMVVALRQPETTDAAGVELIRYLSRADAWPVGPALLELTIGPKARPAWAPAVFEAFTAFAYGQRSNPAGGTDPARLASAWRAWWEHHAGSQTLRVRAPVPIPEWPAGGTTLADLERWHGAAKSQPQLHQPLPEPLRALDGAAHYYREDGRIYAITLISAFKPAAAWRRGTYAALQVALQAVPLWSAPGVRGRLFAWDGAAGIALAKVPETGVEIARERLQRLRGPLARLAAAELVERDIIYEVSLVPGEPIAGSRSVIEDP